MSGLATLREFARALGGDVVGAQVLAPGPGHSNRDRSLSVRLSLGAPDGFVVHSHCGDDWRDCRDHVLERLGVAPEGRQRPGASTSRAPPRHIQSTAAGDDDTAAKKRRAAALWHEAVGPGGTVVEHYLASRRLDLTEDLPADVRFHPQCPWKDEQTGRVLYVPAMLAAMRNIVKDEIMAVHRTVLTPEGKKVGRRMLGVAAGAAIKLDSDDSVTQGLTVGEGIETCLAARQVGLRPVWAMGSVGAIAGFPVLDGIECLTLLRENDEASRRACEQCASRWHAAGREMIFVTSKVGSDINDALLGAAR